MLNPNSTLLNPVRKFHLIFLTIKELRILTNKENIKIKNYLNLSLISKEITHFMEQKTTHNYLPIKLKTHSIRQNENPSTLDYNHHLTNQRH